MSYVIYLLSSRTIRCGTGIADSSITALSAWCGWSYRCGVGGAGGFSRLDGMGGLPSSFAASNVSTVYGVRFADCRTVFTPLSVRGGRNAFVFGGLEPHRLTGPSVNFSPLVCKYDLVHIRLFLWQPPVLFSDAG